MKAVLRTTLSTAEGLLLVAVYFAALGTTAGASSTTVRTAS